MTSCSKRSVEIEKMFFLISLTIDHCDYFHELEYQLVNKL